MKAFFLQMVSDEKDRISSARFLNLLVGVTGCFITLLLAFTGNLSGEYFISLLAYGTGNFGMGKFLDNRTKPTP